MADPGFAEFHYGPEKDTTDVKEWSQADLDDLRTTLARGGSIEDVAIFLCRAGTHDRLRKKADDKCKAAVESG